MFQVTWKTVSAMTARNITGTVHGLLLSAVIGGYAIMIPDRAASQSAAPELCRPGADQFSADLSSVDPSGNDRPGFYKIDRVSTALAAGARGSSLPGDRVPLGGGELRIYVVSLTDAPETAILTAPGNDAAMPPGLRPAACAAARAAQRLAGVLDPSGSANQSDPSGSANQSDPSGSGSQVDPSGSGALIDVTGVAEAAGIQPADLFAGIRSQPGKVLMPSRILSMDAGPRGQVFASAWIPRDAPASADAPLDAVALNCVIRDGAGEAPRVGAVVALGFVAGVPRDALTALSREICDAATQAERI